MQAAARPLRRGLLMPCWYEILPDHRLIRVTGSGTVQREDLFSVYRAFAADPAFEPHLDCLWDFGRVESTDLSSGDVQALAALPRLFDDTARQAVVVRTDLGFGLTRMFQLMGRREAESFVIFRSLAEAESWLARPGSPVRPGP